MSSDPPPPTNLCDMPLELVGLVAERVPDTESRCALGKCCKSYRELMKDIEVVIEELTVTFGPGQRVCIQFDWETESEVCYYDDDGKCKIQRTNSEKRWRVKELEGNCLEVAVNDLMTILQNPKLIVKKLDIFLDGGLGSENEPYLILLTQKLSKLNHKLHVEYGKFWCCNEDELMQILSFYQPGTLKKLEIALENQEGRPLSQIFNLEQWMQAEELRSTVVQPLNKLLHFKRVKLCDYFSHHSKLPWTELNDFIQNVKAQADSHLLEFVGHRFLHSPEAIRFCRSLKKIPSGMLGTKTFLLKNLPDGIQLVIVMQPEYFGIHEYVNGEDVTPI